MKIQGEWIEGSPDGNLVVTFKAHGKPITQIYEDGKLPGEKLILKLLPSPLVLD